MPRYTGSAFRAGEERERSAKLKPFSVLSRRRGPIADSSRSASKSWARRQHDAEENNNVFYIDFHPFNKRFKACIGGAVGRSGPEFELRFFTKPRLNPFRARCITRPSGFTTRANGLRGPGPLCFSPGVTGVTLTVAAVSIAGPYRALYFLFCPRSTMT